MVHFEHGFKNITLLQDTFMLIFNHNKVSVKLGNEPILKSVEKETKL